MSTSPKNAAPKNNGSTSKAGQSGAGQTDDSENDPLQKLKQQHAELKALLIKNGEAGVEHMELVRAIARLWVPHTIVEEEVIYPAVSAKLTDQSSVREAQVRRDLVKILLRDLLREAPEAEFFEAKLNVLRAELAVLMKLEEKPTHGLLALGAANGVDVETLRPHLERFRGQFERDAEEDALHPPAPRSLRFNSAGVSKETDTMQRQQKTTPERDDQGRFMSERDRHRARPEFWPEFSVEFFFARRALLGARAWRMVWRGIPKAIPGASRRGWDERDPGVARAAASRPAVALRMTTSAAGVRSRDRPATMRVHRVAAMADGSAIRRVTPRLRDADGTIGEVKVATTIVRRAVAPRTMTIAGVRSRDRPATDEIRSSGRVPRSRTVPAIRRSPLNEALTVLMGRSGK